MDERWEKVWASVLPLFVGSDEELELLAEEPVSWFEIRVEVDHDGMHYYSIQRIHKDDLQELNETEGAFGWLLEQMVQVVDGYMNNGAVV